MKPKKKDNTLEILFAIVMLVAVVFISWHAGMANTAVKAEQKETAEAAQTQPADAAAKQKPNNIEMFMRHFENSLNNNTTDFKWDENVKKALMWGCFVWFIVVAYIATNKKKYIRGKEFGTAVWGSKKDISDLTASNIMLKEIKRAKKCRTAIGRYFAEKEIRKACDARSNGMMKTALNNIEEYRGDRKEYARRKATIIKEAREAAQASYEEGWMPAKIKREYQSALASIKDKKEKGYMTREEYEKACESEKKKRDADLHFFFHAKDRIDKIKKKYANADALFTKTEKISIYNYALNNNTLILGGSGSGKTRGFVMPNILQAHSSYVITDPKGEILEKSGHFLEKIKGYKIRVLNLDNKEASDCYNPFMYIHPERAGYEERVMSLIEVIIINTDGGEKRGGSDPFWDKAERLFLQAIFFFVCDGFVPHQRNMNTVNDLISMLTLEEEQDKKDSDLDYFVETFARDNGEDHIGVQQYREFRGKAAGKTAKSIAISAVARLAPFKTKSVKRIFADDSMRLETIGEELTAIFVVVPPTDPTFNFIAGMLFMQMFQELQYSATQVHRQRLPVPVRFILDEFANTCKIPEFVKILAYARSFGIGIVPILQSLEQIKNLYKDEWGVIVDNCNTLLFLGAITHMETLEYMSKLLGKGTFDKKTTGRTRGRSGTSSQNFDVIGRDLMDTAEIRKIPKTDCLFIVGGRNPFYSTKYSYETHPNYGYTSDADRTLSYKYTPQVITKREEVNIKAHVALTREEEARLASESVKHITENISKTMNKIYINTDAARMLNSFGKAYVHYTPVGDEESPYSAEEYIGTLADIEEDDTRVDALIALDSVEEVVTNSKENGIEVIDTPSDLYAIIEDAGENLAPAPNETMNVEDGEDEYLYEGDYLYIEDVEDIGDDIARYVVAVNAEYTIDS